MSYLHLLNENLFIHGCAKGGSPNQEMGKLLLITFLFAMKIEISTFDVAIFYIHQLKKQLQLLKNYNCINCDIHGEERHDVTRSSP